MGLGSFISRVADPVGNLINGITGVNSQTDKTYKQQINAMNAQNAYNQYMWNLQNQYNSPSAQLARMAEAGIDINPTSYALGTGNLSNTAVHVGSASGFSGNGSPAGNPISMAMGVAQGIAGIKSTQASTENTLLRNELLPLEMESTQIENDIKRHNLKYAQDNGIPVGDHDSFITKASALTNWIWKGGKAMWSLYDKATSPIVDPIVRALQKK